MVTLEPLDKNVSIVTQMSVDASPVVLINTFQVDEADIPKLLAAWENDANWMKKQPGYISAQLHRGIAGSTVFLNYAVWGSVSDFRKAFNHPEFQAAMSKYPDSTVISPHLFSKVAVPNICVGS